MRLLPEPRIPGAQWRAIWGGTERDTRRRIGRALRSGRAVDDAREAALERQLASREIALYLVLAPAALGVAVVDAISVDWISFALWAALSAVLVVRLAMSWRAVRRIDERHDDLPDLRSPPPS